MLCFIWRSHLLIGFLAANTIADEIKICTPATEPCSRHTDASLRVAYKPTVRGEFQMP